MKNRLILFLVKQLIGGDFGPSKFDMSPKARMIAYKEAYQVENFTNLLRNQMVFHVRSAALRATTQEELWFQRGCIFALQNLQATLKKNHALWIKEAAKEQKPS